MRKTRNRIIKKLLIFVLMFLPLAMILIEPIQSIAVSPTTINLWTYGQTTAPNHAHIWSMKFDEKYHWEECSVCLTTRNKVAHTLVGNGGSKVDCDNGYYNQAYR